MQDQLRTDGWEVLDRQGGRVHRVHPPSGWPPTPGSKTFLAIRRQTHAHGSGKPARPAVWRDTVSPPQKRKVRRTGPASPANDVLTTAVETWR